MDVLVFCLLLVESIIRQVKQFFYCILAHSGTHVDALGVCFLGRLKNAKEEKGWAQDGCFCLHKMTSNVGTRRRVVFENLLFVTFLVGYHLWLGDTPRNTTCYSSLFLLLAVSKKPLVISLQNHQIIGSFFWLFDHTFWWILFLLKCNPKVHLWAKQKNRRNCVLFSKRAPLESWKDLWDSSKSEEKLKIAETQIMLSLRLNT